MSEWAAFDPFGVDCFIKVMYTICMGIKTDTLSSRQLYLPLKIPLLLHCLLFCIKNNTPSQPLDVLFFAVFLLDYAQITFIISLYASSKC